MITLSWKLDSACWFNGAVDSRRRRAVAQAERDGVLGLQWGRRLSSTESCSARRRLSGCTSGFNGAVDFRRRRDDATRVLGVNGDLASMGPSTFVDGEDVDKAAPLAQVAASMGPSTFVDGELPSNRPESRSLLLQWGRRLSSTERSPAAAKNPVLQWDNRRISRGEATTCRPSVSDRDDDKLARGANREHRMLTAGVHRLRASGCIPGALDLFGVLTRPILPARSPWPRLSCRLLEATVTARYGPAPKRHGQGGAIRIVIAIVDGVWRPTQVG